MKLKIFALLALLTMLPGVTACGDAPIATTEPLAINEPPAQELGVSVDDAILYVKIVGDPQVGNVLIAVNGGPGMPSDMMVSLEQLASAEFAVVTYDQRGTGRSTSPSPEASNYTLLKYVEDL